ncbi:MAG: cellulase family glycosylhydrolase [Proteobacteria bacterium]|nr:cellulase family glycosylhydrolase [Pseudomonadota bacterium]
MTIRTEQSRFVDEAGRTLILRGVNLGGSCKLPRQPNGATHHREGFFEHRDVSFVGRPFPLAEADRHFERLRAWGFTFLRLLVTWEAIEHAGPGRYDEAYLDSMRALVERAGEHGFHVFIDPHQDVWSRFSGGDGAPGWTLEAVGFDLTQLAATGAAFVHQLHSGPLPRMIWPSNETKLAAATMFTLFFAGDAFAPETRVEGEPVQAFLQRHYIDAVCQLAERLRDLPHVVGYDTLNEPLPGYIGWGDLAEPGGMVKVGACPSPFQAMLAGAGHPQTVATFAATPIGFRRTGRTRLNPDGARAWRAEADCVWRQNGVWDVDAEKRPTLLRPDHFARHRGRAVDFSQDFYLPFARRFTAAVRNAHPGALVFVETAPDCAPPQWDEPGLVHAPHWYDGFVLLFKRYSDWLAVDNRRRRLVATPWRIRRSFARQLEELREEGSGLGGAPTLIGEFGIAFDLNGKRAYRTGDDRAQVKAMDRSLRALDDALLSGTLWNYTPDNTHAHGDHWNGEDLSIFCRDEQSDPSDLHSGGRALEAVARPYARATAGEPLRMHYDRRRRQFEFAFRHDPAVSAPTEIAVPAYTYPHGVDVEVSDGSAEWDAKREIVVYRHTTQRRVHTLQIRPRAGARTAG